MSIGTGMVDKHVTITSDPLLSEAYYRSSVDVKTEQQKMLERLISERQINPHKVADIACGGGGTSYHLAKLFPLAAYSLVDISDRAIALAKIATRHFNATCEVGDIYDLPFDDASFDIVLCWQALSWLEQPAQALQELTRICVPGGMIYVSSLFNSDFDVDIYSTVIDRTGPPGERMSINTYSLHSVREWVQVSEIKLLQFSIGIDLTYSGRGLKTHTVVTATGNRLEISGGMLLNWGILEMRK